MNKRELEKAIKDEVDEWPGLTVEFVAATGNGHPKMKLTFTPEGGEPLMLSRAYPGTPSAQSSLHKTIADVRRMARQLGATRPKPEPSPEETERRYSKPNDGAEKRPDPVAGERASIKPTVGDQLVQHGLASAEAAETAENERRGVSGKTATTVIVDDPAAADDPPDADAAADMLERLRAIGLDFEAHSPTLVDVIAAAVGAIVDGVYFGLPAEVYHEVPRLSASGLQRLCVSPATFWKGSWLDPERPELDEEETKAQILGKAYHVARLEPDRFESCYVRELSKDDYPKRGFLSSDEKVKAELKARGCQQTVTGESTAERSQRLLDDGFEGTCFPLEKAKWEAQVRGRIPIPAKHYDQIVTDMERIRGNSEISELLSGGEAEVSIFWTDQYGLKMKARLDYLTPERWDDLKTFDNSRGKLLEQAIADFVRYNRVHVQAVTYRDAIEAIRTGGLQIIGNATESQRKLVAAIQMRPGELACWFIFQEKNGVPNLLAYEFPFFGAPYDHVMWEGGATEEQVAAGRAAVSTKTGLHIRAMQDIDRAKRSFVLYSEVYKPGDPWFPIEARGRLSDLAFNSKWLEGEQA